MKNQNPTSQKKFMIETLESTMLFPKLISSIFISADKSLLSLAEKYKLLQILHYLLSISLYAFLFFLRFLPSLFPYLIPSPALNSPIKPVVKKEREVSVPKGDSSIARALSQILSIMNVIPVNSRKYETVRSLAEKLIDENLGEACESLREVNRTALSAAFSMTLSQLEAAMLDQERERVNQAGGYVPLDFWFGRVIRPVRSICDGAKARFGVSTTEVVSRPDGMTAEKLAAELLWLAQKLATCGNAEEAVSKWGTASNLASLALSAELRLQGSLVKISACLFKQAREMGKDKEERKEDVEEESNRQELLRQRRIDLLMCWLPFLCRASNGSDEPVLTSIEKREVERVLEAIIEMLKEEEQERVLALWLHHFTSCPSSDWPNLQACYARWCSVSRKILALRCTLSAPSEYHDFSPAGQSKISIMGAISFK